MNKKQEILTEQLANDIKYACSVKLRKAQRIEIARILGALGYDKTVNPAEENEGKEKRCMDLQEALEKCIQFNADGSVDYWMSSIWLDDEGYRLANRNLVKENEYLRGVLAESEKLIAECLKYLQESTRKRDAEG